MVHRNDPDILTEILTRFFDQNLEMARSYARNDIRGAFEAVDAVTPPKLQSGALQHSPAELQFDMAVSDARIAFWASLYKSYPNYRRVASLTPIAAWFEQVSKAAALDWLAVQVLDDQP